MRKLLASLKESDTAVLAEIARFWRVDISKLSPTAIPETLALTLLDPDKAAQAWDKLSDAERGALQTLMGGLGKEKRMPKSMFMRLYGDIRKLGRAQIERDKVLETGSNPAETLFYHGFIYEIFEPTGDVIYMPEDLHAALPTHKTSYDDLDDLPVEASPEEVPTIDEIEADMIEEVRPADTTIVDDMTALLAYLRMYRGTVIGDTLDASDVEAMEEQLLNPDPARLSFLLQMGISTTLIDVQEGVAFPNPGGAKRWLESKRSEQLRVLAEGWLKSTFYRDLWHIEGLHPEPTGWPYEPAKARQAVMQFMQEQVPVQGWWGVDDFIFAIKAITPDFQRPNGDYDSWYIRNDRGDYLRGFESWDAVEGALLEFYLQGPMHWLGLLDLAEDAVRLTAYGRAFVTEANWPSPPEQDEPVLVEKDGTLRVSRKTSRFDRYQVMRFADWGAVATTSTPYIYRLTAESIRRAGGQGINTGHITAFLTHVVDPLPQPIVRLLEAWQAGPSSQVTLENLIVLRTTSPETLDFINNTPALRRYLGARLGPMAVVVRADQWEALREALGEQGIQVDLVE
ncbi:MAG: hypothetical protein OHK0046_12860 [Anaerolineae bacterium]